MLTKSQLKDIELSTWGTPYQIPFEQMSEHIQEQAAMLEKLYKVLGRINNLILCADTTDMRREAARLSYEATTEYEKWKNQT